MIGTGGQRILRFLCGLAAVTVIGCADLDLPSWVPFQGPASDTLPGVVTPAEKISSLKSLAEKTSERSPEEKKRISEQLALSIRTEQDPLIRKEIIRTLGHYPSPAADAVLKAALDDPEALVRATACEAWGRRRDAQAVALLSETLRSDVDMDVRLAAAQALGETRNAAAVQPLGELLDDSDPAMQYRAVLALKQATGKDLGNDVGRWQAYVKGKQPEPAPTWAERIRHWF